MLLFQQPPDSERVFDSIFLSYNEILNRFHTLGVTTKHGKEIKHVDFLKIELNNMKNY